MTIEDAKAAYASAVAEEQQRRRMAFLPVSQSLCGVDVRLLTPIDVLTLSAVESPFVCGNRDVTPADIVLFLWSQSAEKATPLRWLETESRRRRNFAKRVGSLDAVDAVQQIITYIENSFADKGTPPKSGGPSYAEWPAAIVDEFAREYGWSADAILRTPFVQLWQYRRFIIRRENPKAILFNPSDEAKVAWMKALNGKET